MAGVVQLIRALSGCIACQNLSRDDKLEAVEPSSTGAGYTANSVTARGDECMSVQVSWETHLCIEGNLPAATVSVAEPLAFTAKAGQDLNSINPQSSSQ